MASIRDVLRRRLEPTPEPVPGPGDRLAAVLALIVGEHGPRVVFTERSADLRRHAGEMSFPGGLQEPEDGSLLETALREAKEEIGLDPRAPDVLGALPSVHTFVSGILVVPFVGALDEAPDLAPADGEIARIVSVPLAVLATVEKEVAWVRPGGEPWNGWVYEVDGATIWGATGRMLHELLALAREVAA
jgi:8-oxo-dGTP pyrophosphatase MutT (NUDIX family)